MPTCLGYGENHIKIRPRVVERNRYNGTLESAYSLRWDAQSSIRDYEV